jgi:hypothetical protein
MKHVLICRKKTKCLQKQDFNYLWTNCLFYDVQTRISNEHNFTYAYNKADRKLYSEIMNLLSKKKEKKLTR